MPEHPELAVVFAAFTETLIGVVHTQELVVLGNDLGFALMEEDEVLDVIQQAGLFAQTVRDVLQAGGLLGNFLAIYRLLLTLHPEPVKEVFPASREAAHPGFQGIR